MKLLTAPFRLVAKALLKIGRLLGHLGLRAIKVAVLSLVAGLVIFVLDWVLVKDSGRPGDGGDTVGE